DAQLDHTEGLVDRVGIQRDFVAGGKVLHVDGHAPGKALPDCLQLRAQLPERLAADRPCLSLCYGCHGPEGGPQQKEEEDATPFHCARPPAEVGGFCSSLVSSGSRWVFFSRACRSNCA